MYKICIGYKMKIPNDFHIKKRMARIAKPILEVMLSDLEPEERKKIFRKVIRDVYSLNKTKETAYMSAYTGKVNFKPNLRLNSFGHELMHKLRRHMHGQVNHYVLANAVDMYLEKSKSYLGEETYKLIDLLKSPVCYPENLRPLKFLEKLDVNSEYNHGFYATGACLSNHAIYLDSATNTPGAGLFYFKLISDGHSPNVAKRLVLDGNVPGMNEFSEKYGRRWMKILGGKI
jgi:hypothetical protein